MDKAVGSKRVRGMWEWDKPAANQVRRAVPDQVPFNPFALDGVPVEDDDRPRKDIGPTGSNLKKNRSKKGDDSTGLMFSWASDYIKRGGELVNEDLRGMGVFPSLPKIPMSPQKGFYPWNPFQDAAGRVVSQENAGIRLGYDVALNEVYNPNSAAAAHYGNQISSGSSSCSSGYDTCSLGSPEAGQTASPRVRNDNDVKEFAERFGHVGRLRAGLLYKPRRGKYYKSFNE